MKRIALILAIAASTSPAFGDDRLVAPFLPPEHLVLEVIANHPMVTAAEARFTESRAEAKLRKAGDHDTLVSASFARRDTRYDGNFTEWDSTISRGIRLPGKAKLDREIGALGIEVADNNLDDARHQTALLLKNHWFEWLEAASMEAIDRAALATWQQELAAVRRKAEVREAAMLDIQEINAALAGAEAELLASSARLEETRSALLLMFPNLPLPATAPELTSPQAVPLDSGYWRDLILSRSHELKAAEREAARQMTVARRSKQDRLPDPTVGVRLFSERGGEESGVGLVVSMPFGFGRRAAISDIDRARALTAEAQSLQVRREIELVADRDVRQAASAFTVWERAAESLGMAQAVTAKIRRARELGDRSLTDVLRTVRQEQMAARTELLARARAHDTRTQLMIDAHELWITPHEE